MIKVRVQGILAVREALGQAELTLEMAEGSTLDDVLARLPPKAGSLVRQALASEGAWPGGGYVFLINGQNIHFLNGYRTVLAEGDTVTIIPLVAGG